MNDIVPSDILSSGGYIIINKLNYYYYYYWHSALLAIKKFYEITFGTGVHIPHIFPKPQGISGETTKKYFLFLLRCITHFGKVIISEGILTFAFPHRPFGLTEIYTYVTCFS